MTLILLFVCLSLTGIQFSQGEVSHSVQSTVFNPQGAIPSGWTSHLSSNVQGKRVKFVRVWGKDIPPEFRYMVRAREFQYNFKLPSQGEHTIKLGLVEKKGKTCVPKRRQAVFKVNQVESNVVDAAEQAGCGVPMYVNITFVVPTTRSVSLSFQKLPKKWAPTLSNFQIFKIIAVSTAPQPNSPGYNPADALASTVPKASIALSPKSPALSPFSPTPSRNVSVSAPASASSPSQLSVCSQTPILQCPSPDKSNEFIENGVCKKPNNIELDIGPSTPIDGSSVLRNKAMASVDFSLVKDVPHDAFSFARQGVGFSVSFDVDPGLYTVTLAFLFPTAEDCGPKKRVFHVTINGHSRITSYDIAESLGCGKVDVKTFIDQPVDILRPEPMVISFTSVIGNAFVNYIRVSPSKKLCDTSKQMLTGIDHLAHSVPGTYPTDGRKAYTDHAGQGFVAVTLDGLGSHTHYYNGESAGEIKSYTWTIANSGLVLSREPVFTYNFPVGTTHLRLTVTDNMCSEDEADTYVTVTDTLADGAFCYYFEGISSKLQLQNDGITPSHASVVDAPVFNFQEVSHRKSEFAAKCEFLMEVANNTGILEISLDSSGGDAYVYVDGRLQLASGGNAMLSTMISSTGFVTMELHFIRNTFQSNPRVSLSTNCSANLKFKFEQGNLKPFITSIDPSYGSSEGGTEISVFGYGLQRSMKLYFGENCVAARFDILSSSVRVVLPSSFVAANVSVWIETETGFRSNSLIFEYDNSCDSVSFQEQVFTHKNGSDYNVPHATAVSLWQDGSLYIGTREGLVHVIKYQLDNLLVTSHCYSKPLFDTRYTTDKGKASTRAILGITFDPRDLHPRPYVSVSSLFWQRQGEISNDNSLAWSNGAIERLKPVSIEVLSAGKGVCLEHDVTIVQNVPVSDGDHSVNELLFTQYGDILVGVGGNTNMGLPYFKLGGNWESPLSSAVLIAHTSRPSFNGTILYSTPQNLRTAVPKTDDVSIYATGVRNLFAMSMTRNGKIFGLDMGPNCGFGNASSHCGEYDEYEASQRSVRNPEPFPGLTKVGNSPRCMYSVQRKDKLVEIFKNAFYGHPNLQRAKWLKFSGECAWIDPISDIPTGHAVSPPKNYESPLALIQSPATGIREYGGTEFCERMRGNLIVSVLNGRRTWEVGLKSNQGGKANVKKISSSGGLRVEESIWGDLMFVPYQANHPLFALRPVVRKTSKLRIVNILPFRHGKKGGSTIMVGGWGFNQGVHVYIGGQPSKVLEVFARKIVCVVPPFRSGNLSKAVSVKLGASTHTLKQALLYMHV